MREIAEVIGEGLKVPVVSLSPQWGLHLAARGGKQAKSKAVVAVARKLAVLLPRLWSTQEPYMPFYEQAA